MSNTQPALIDFSKLKERVNIEKIVGHYSLDLKRQGESFVGKCPFCGGSENTRKFKVTPSKGVGGAFNCFDCDAHGNPIDLVAQMEDVKPIKAAQMIAEWFNIDDCFYEKSSAARRTTKQKPPVSKKPAAKKATAAQPASASDYETDGDDAQTPSDVSAAMRHNPPLTWDGLKNLDTEADEIVHSDLMPDTLDHFGAGFCRAGLMTGRLAVPIHNRTGNLLGYAGIDLAQERPDEELFGDPKSDRIRWPPEEKYDPRLDLFNFHRAVQSEQYQLEGLILVPDIVDVFDLFERGFENVVAILGDTFTEQQALKLEALDKPLSFITLWCSPTHPIVSDVVLRVSRFGYVRLVTPKERAFTE